MKQFILLSLLIITLFSCKKSANNNATPTNPSSNYKILIGNYFLPDTVYVDEGNTSIFYKGETITYTINKTQPSTSITLYHQDSVVNTGVISSTGLDSIELSITGIPYGSSIPISKHNFASATYVGRN